MNSSHFFARLCIVVSLAAYSGLMLAPSVASPGSPRLLIQAEGEKLVLYFAAPNEFGSVRIIASDRVEALLSEGKVLLFEPVPESGNGTLVITNTTAGEHQFFAAIWSEEIPSPATGQWHWVPRGLFQMGSPENEQDRDADEGPSSSAAITRGFLMGAYEVTQSEYAAVMSTNPSLHQGDPQLPVENVSWLEAVEYCRALTQREREAGRLSALYGYRLPTEAEWEFAARNGSVTRFFFGDDPGYTALPDYAWFDQNSGAASHPVGLKKPSPTGLFDIYGNVAEWCSDWYGPYVGGLALDPAGPIMGEDHVIRGGSYLDEGQFCRSAFRLYDWTTNRFEDVGFRVVLAPVMSAVHPDQPLPLVTIQPGTFLMGSPGPVSATASDELPQTAVTLVRGFSMGQFEVTQAEYLSIMGTNPSYFNTGQLNRPVEQVSWFDAMEFCRRLTEREQQAGRLPAEHEYRLPTEAEWEYAVRAGTTAPYFYGDDSTVATTAAYAWSFTDGMTFGVGAKKANPWGLHDVYGNVFEWCLDWYGEYVGGQATDPAGTENGLYRAMRGGSYLDGPEFCRSAFRMYESATNRFQNVGFRVVLVATNALPAASPELIRIDPQVFQIGSPVTEVDRQSDEGPQIEVRLDYSFWMGKYEVTQRQFSDLMGINPSYYRGPSHRPAEQVTWEVAVAYCRTLTDREREAGKLPEGHEYRLPTEAEWECAARAGSTNRFSYGDDPEYTQLSDYAWNLVAPSRGIGGKQPNAWGFHDLYGNVSEWCLDWYGPYPDGKRVNPRGPQTGTWRVVRGGSFDDAGAYCRSAFRNAAWPDEADRTIGFRVVLAPIQQPSSAPAIELVQIEPGQFVMGSPVEDSMSAPDEVPSDIVTITRPFSIGKFEITQAQYLAVVGTNVSRYLDYLDQPVENVTWDEAQTFCTLLTQREAAAGRLPANQAYRLPTEAEWEYACRAGSTNRYSFGDDPALLADFAWYLNNGDFRPHIVGAKSPNAFGLHDMHGNVAEWCSDWYGPYSAGQRVDPIGPESGESKTIRGGSHTDYDRRCRSAARRFAAPGQRFGTVGFRVVLSYEEPAKPR